MDKDKKNKIILISIVGILLISVIGFIIYSVCKDNKKLDNETVIKFNQIYSSDYKLENMDSKYFIGSYEKNKLNVIIDSTGSEVYKAIGDIYYDGVFMMKDGSYLIYNNRDNKLNVYSFNGSEVKNYYSIDDVSYVKPIIYKDNNYEYIVGFASSNDTDLYIYNIDNQGISVLKDTTLVGDLYKNDIYYVYNENNLIVKNKDGLMGSINLVGEEVIPFVYKNLINVCNNSLIALNKKDNYGIIDINNKTLLSFKYKAIKNFNDYYLIVNKYDKMALYDSNLSKLVDYKMNYDTLIDFDLRNSANSIKLYEISPYIVVINNNLESVNGTEYELHNMYVIKDGKIVKTINETGFGCKDLIYSYDKDNKVSIYNSDFSINRSISLDKTKKIMNVRYVSSDILEVTYKGLETNELVYIDKNNKEVEFKLGDLIFMNDTYSLYLTSDSVNKVLNVYNSSNELSDTISGKYIKINGDFIIVDNSIYKLIFS